MHGMLYSIGNESDSASATDDSSFKVEGHKCLSQQLPRTEDQVDDITATTKDHSEWNIIHIFLTMT